MTNQAMFQRIVDNLSVAVLLFDSDLKLTFINSSGEMLFEASFRQISGITCDELLHGPNHLTDILAFTRSSGQIIMEREIELVLAGPRYTTVDCTVTPLDKTRHTSPSLLVELQQVDRKMRILRDEKLIAEHSATRAVVRGLAHEINNPLGGLRGAAQLLERELHDDSLKEYTRVIIGEADRLQNLLARMMGPKAVPEKRPVNVHEILERVRTLLLAEAPNAISIKRDYDPSIPDLKIDPDLIIQAILNIGRNAVQALEKQGKIIFRTRVLRQYTIGTQRYKLVASIDIIDNGPGIAPDIAGNIFYPMVTGRAEGTGLGLSIAQSIVNQHEGLIECKSQTGCTQFTILLPLEKNHG